MKIMDCRRKCRTRSKGNKARVCTGKTVIRSSGNAKDLRNEILTEQRNVGHAEPHVRKVTEIRKDDRNMDTRRK